MMLEFPRRRQAEMITFPPDWNAKPMFDIPDDETDHGNETDNGPDEDAEP
jgi:hypothetical protein